MGKHERRAYLEQIRGRYQRAKRADKAKILDEFCAVCGYHRKHAIRLLKRRRKAQPKVRPGRKPRFDHPQLLQAIRTIWLASDQMCSKKLKAALPLWIPHYEAEYGPLEPAVKALLDEISTSTLDRLLKPIRVEMPGKGLSPHNRPAHTWGLVGRPLCSLAQTAVVSCAIVSFRRIKLFARRP